MMHSRCFAEYLHGVPSCNSEPLSEFFLARLSYPLSELFFYDSCQSPSCNPYQNHSYDPCQNPAYNPSQSPYQPKLEALPLFKLSLLISFLLAVSIIKHIKADALIFLKEKLCWITLTTRSCCRWRHKGLCQWGKRTPHCEDTRHCSFWGWTVDTNPIALVMIHYVL